MRPDIEASTVQLPLWPLQESLHGFAELDPLAVFRRCTHQLLSTDHVFWVHTGNAVCLVQSFDGAHTPTER